MLQHFFIEGQYSGTAERSMEFVHAQLTVPTSYWFLCPICGEQWAKVVVECEDRGRWQAVVTCCRKHGRGSIWRELDAEYTEALPLPVLLWEFQRELEHYDKGIHETARTNPL